MMPGAVMVAAVAVLGLMVGSFLNVCIHRIPRGRSVVSPGSRCPGCGRPIAWRDNVPVLSYLALGGRCRACRTRIPAMYPIVEAATAAVFVALYLRIGPQPLLLSRLLFSSAMVALFVIDLQHRILPNAITLPGIAAGFALSLVLPPGWISSAIGIAIGGGVLLLVAEAYYRVRKEEGLGMGDVKMLAMIGAFLGWPLMLLTLVLSSFLGSLVGIAIIVSRRGDMKYALPFGTFLAAAAILAALLGDDVIAWYMSFY
jgi:leader peptidase (prepilin peptidase)/N-methyltransferase